MCLSYPILLVASYQIASPILSEDSINTSFLAIISRKSKKVDSVDLDAAFQWKKYFVIYRIDFSCDSQKRQNHNSWMCQTKMGASSFCERGRDGIMVQFWSMHIKGSMDEWEYTQAVEEKIQLKLYLLWEGG